jgi:hypothetical protein
MKRDNTMRTEYNKNLQDYICHAGEDFIKVVSVEARTDYTLVLTFSTGETKLYDFKPQLDFNVFAPLKNPALFIKAKSLGGGVAWTDEIDIASEHLYYNSTPVADTSAIQPTHIPHRQKGQNSPIS